MFTQRFANDSYESHTLQRTARGLCAIALALWAVALLLIIVIAQTISYTVCDGPLFHIPPPAVHWPPVAHNDGLLGLQHAITLSAVATSVLGMFSLLLVAPGLATRDRIRWFLATVAGSLLAAGVLWLVVERFDVGARLNALASCL